MTPSRITHALTTSLVGALSAVVLATTAGAQGQPNMGTGPVLPKSGTIPLARNCPAISSRTIGPGSFRPIAASARATTGIPAREISSPDVKSPTAATTLGM